MNETPPKTLIAYMQSPPQKGGAAQLGQSSHVLRQKQQVQAYLEQHPHFTLRESFIEIKDSKKNKQRWNALDAALAECTRHNATLLIVQLHNLTHYEQFSHKIISFLQAPHAGAAPHQLICLDQPFIQRDNFEAVVEHARQQRKMHGELIKAGLSKTQAKSGNPNAADVINQVNRPKIDNAVLFAFMLQPVVNDYIQKGYSQRKIVNALNDENYYAPEGGKWVLSQLQKVLERIKLNESALQLEAIILEKIADNMSYDTIASSFNASNIKPPKGKLWSEELVQKTHQRIEQLHQIIKTNECLLHLLPLLNKYKNEELNEAIFIEELQAMGISIEANSLKQPVIAA